MARKWYGTRPYEEYTSASGGTSTNVTYDATGAGNAVDSGSNSVNITWSHTATGGTNSAVVVTLLVGGVSASYSTFTRSVTYDGNAMTSLIASDGNNNGWVEIFYLLNPPSGAKTVSVTVSKASTSFGRVSANSISYTNISAVQTGIASNSIASAATSVALYADWSVATGMAGSKTLSVFGIDGSATITSTIVNSSMPDEAVTFPDMGSTVRWTSNSGTTSGMTSVLAVEAPGTMFTAHNFTMSGSARSAIASCQLKSVGTSVPSGIHGCWLTIIGAGGGGGSGRRGAAGSARYGGAGGGGGGVISERYIPVQALGSTYSVYVPPVATGGAAVTADSTNGNKGTRVPDALFGSGNITLSGASGHGGHGGSSAAPSVSVNGGLTGGINGHYGGFGGASSVSANAADGIYAYAATGGLYYVSAGGGGGGGISTSNVAYSGGSGGKNRLLGLSGGAGGTAPGSAPGVGSSAVAGVVGSGAGGGGAAVSPNTGQAGASATGYGAGGGGGGASANTYNSGAGGDGGPAYVRILWDYR